ncbi:MAG: flagellar basal body rod protein FlgC [Alphaproteobacteria bacterium]|nr:flagellar basal body rod protein FlgC [Alphaproteobacteria bacterium]
MDLITAMEQASHGMKAQGTRMRIISENMANAETTGKTPTDNPYRRQVVTFKDEVNRADGVKEVQVDKIVNDPTDFTLKYEPGHPAANADGYVKMPNVNPLLEMMDMREAQRSYEANLGVIQVSRSMLMRTIDLLRSSG